jgi:hypothetical protein
MEMPPTISFPTGEFTFSCPSPYRMPSPSPRMPSPSPHGTSLVPATKGYDKQPVETVAKGKLTRFLSYETKGEWEE